MEGDPGSAELGWLRCLLPAPDAALYARVSRMWSTGLISEFSGGPGGTFTSQDPPLALWRLTLGWKIAGGLWNILFFGGW